jgi:hypothetical protein
VNVETEMKAALLDEFIQWEPGSPGSAGSVDSLERVLDEVREHFAKYICTVNDNDLDVLTLWAAHTYVCEETYTSPRLLIDSPMPGSGKTTLLEHLERLCLRPIQAASLSSPALIPRMLDKGLRTILIDEADRSLDPKKPGVEDLFAILNSGYKRGGSRPVLVQKGNDWEVSEMPTFAPVVMAGNSPHLPEDTKSRCIRVLLLPDLEGRVESSDWEEIENDARVLGMKLSSRMESVRNRILTERPSVPAGCKARNKERWYPLKRVASLAGERWAEIADKLILRDLETQALDKEDGMMLVPPAVQLLTDIAEVWPTSSTFVPTMELVPLLIRKHPSQWSAVSSYGRDLTPQRLGRMLAKGFALNSDRRVESATNPERVRGYHIEQFRIVWRRMGIAAQSLSVTDQTGRDSQTGLEVAP